MSDDLTRILCAASFAAEQHRTQRRKNAESSPYINHPIAVAKLLTEAGVVDVDLLCAALLHDTVEDTETTAHQIREQFGARTCDLVMEVTDDKSLPKQERKRLQIEHAPTISQEAKQLKLADKISNIRDISDDAPTGWEPDRKLDYLDWAGQVVAGLRGANGFLEDLFDQELAAARCRLSGVV